MEDVKIAARMKGRQATIAIYVIQCVLPYNSSVKRRRLGCLQTAADLASAVGEIMPQ